MDWIFLFFITIFTFVYACFKTPEKAFLNIYISVLILTPQIFSARLPGLPELNFAQTVVMPIFIVGLVISFLIKRNISGLHFGLIDISVVGYILCKVISEYVNWGNREAINILASQLTSVLAPYLLAKQYILSRGMTIILARRIVFLLFVVCCLSVYELRFLGDPFISIFQRTFFPGQGNEWPLLLRYGVKRIGGPFVQPILFGMGIGIGIFFNYWLAKNKLWRKTFKYFPVSFFNKATVINIVLVLGLLATFSRGPLISTILGFMIVGIGFSKKRFQSLIIRLIIIFIIGFVGYEVARSSTDINKNMAGDTEGSAAYRFELFNNYIDVVYQRFVWGWGRKGVPVMGGMRSIDNEYLLIALRHGVTTLFFFVSIFVICSSRLLKRGLLDNRNENADSSFCFTLLGIIIMLAISLITVYLGLQLEPIFFIIVGWIAAFLHTKPKDFYKLQIATELSKRPVERKIKHVY